MLVSTILLIVLFQIVPTIPALPSPTPIPTVTPMPPFVSELPEGEIYSFLSTAVANVNAMPDNILAPGGVPLVNDPNASQLFGYAKWLISPTSANELLGTTLAPLSLPVGLLIGAIMLLTSIYLVYVIATFLIKGVVWLLQQVLRVIPFVGVFIVQVPPTPTFYPPPPTAPINIPSLQIWTVAPEVVQRWHLFGDDKTMVVQVVFLIMVVVGCLFAVVQAVRSITGDGESEG